MEVKKNSRNWPQSPPGKLEFRKNEPHTVPSKTAGLLSISVTSFVVIIAVVAGGAVVVVVFVVAEVEVVDEVVVVAKPVVVVIPCILDVSCTILLIVFSIPLNLFRFNK